jgi:hypothetical protein
MVPVMLAAEVCHITGSRASLHFFSFFLSQLDGDVEDNMIHEKTIKPSATL